jgi:phosphomethylpyrimidine synthase
MQITQEVRDYAREKGVEPEEALHKGLEQKAEQFIDEGAEIYH